MGDSGGSLILAAQTGRPLPVTQLFTRKELVGKGAYGGVYKGIHEATGTVVALKVIDLDTPDDDISEIQKEVAILSELRDAARHNITLYHGCYLNGTELWIAMDFASGGSIRTLMKSGPIEEKYAALIIREVLVALSFLHKQNVIHRDVKAANILLTQTGKILLCDFGVAAHLQANSKRSTFTGTPLWMAPEVITDGKMYDTKADVWSLGITLFEIATGNPPYFGMEPLRACALIPRSTPPKLEGGTWSNSMREFLASCLQIDPTVRPTADELSKSKWIKSASKLPMVLLRELIVRYVSWIQSGGQRTSIVGLPNGPGGSVEEVVAREDTFELAEDRWDFDVDEDDFGTGLGGLGGKVEPLGDEPAPAQPRTLDEMAAQSHTRPPKARPVMRDHPLLRLFDEESNPYAQSTAPSAQISLPSGAAAVNTVKPTISIPSLDELDDMSSNPSPFPSSFGGASSGNGFGFGGASSSSFGGGFGYGGASSSTSAFGSIALDAADDLMSPAYNPNATVRASPFAWQPPRFGAPPPTATAASPFLPPSPRFGRSDTPDSLWSGGGGGGSGAGSGATSTTSGGTHTRNSSSTPTEATFPAAELAMPPSFGFGGATNGYAQPPLQQQQQQQHPVTTSPSLPSLAMAPSSSSSSDWSHPASSSSSSSHLNRPFGAAASSPAARRRADTAPSSRPMAAPAPAPAPLAPAAGGEGAYPPLGQGIPRATPAPVPVAAGAGEYPPLGPGLPRSAGGGGTSWERVGGAHERKRSSSAGVAALDSAPAAGVGGGGNRPGGFGGAPGGRDLNRPFGFAGGGRERGMSNAGEAAGGLRPSFRFGGAAAAAAQGPGQGLGIERRERSGSESGNRRMGLKIHTSAGPAAGLPSSIASPATAVPQTPISQLSSAPSYAYPSSTHSSPRHVRGPSHTRAPSGATASGYPFHQASSYVPPPTASASSSFSSVSTPLGSTFPSSAPPVAMQRGDSQTSPRTIPAAQMQPPLLPSARQQGHRPRLSQSHTAPSAGAPPFAAAAPRHLRTSSSASSLLGEEAATPLAPPLPPPLPTVRESPVATGLGRNSAIGYPFPPVGDLAVPSAGGSAPSSAAPSPLATPAPAQAQVASVPLPLDYAALARSEDAAQRELEKTVRQLGELLGRVGEGLERVLRGEVDVGVEWEAEEEDGGIAEDLQGSGEGVVVG